MKKGILERKAKKYEKMIYINTNQGNASNNKHTTFHPSDCHKLKQFSVVKNLDEG